MDPHQHRQRTLGARDRRRRHGDAQAVLVLAQAVRRRTEGLVEEGHRQLRGERPGVAAVDRLCRVALRHRRREALGPAVANPPELHGFSGAAADEGPAGCGHDDVLGGVLQQVLPFLGG